MSERPVIYIAGPISLGCKSHNLHQACVAHLELLRRGFAVINPILTMLLPGAWDVSHDEWVEADLPVVDRCDALLRLPGDSVGAEAEVARAVQRKIPVFLEVDKLIAWRATWRKNQRNGEH